MLSAMARAKALHLLVFPVLFCVLFTFYLHMQDNRSAQTERQKLRSTRDDGEEEWKVSTRLVDGTNLPRNFRTSGGLRGAKRRHGRRTKPRAQRPVPSNCSDLVSRNISRYRTFCTQLHPGSEEKMADLTEGDDLPIKRGTMLYLVQGNSEPSQFWKNVSVRTDSFIIWLSWGALVLRSEQEPSFTEYVFYPKSSFNRGRNFLLKRGLHAELVQQWRFEYFVFADEDQDMMTVAWPSLTKKAIWRAFPRRGSDQTNAWPRPIAVLNYLLLWHRPARAGIHLQHPRHSPPPFARCVSTPTIDMAVEAFHRTVLAAMMPYNSKYDDENWWFSTPIMNMAAQMFLGPYSVQFRQIVVYPKAKGQKHARYPAQRMFDVYQHELLCYLRRCLATDALRADVLYRPYSASLVMSMMPVEREKDPLPCLRMPKDVDYSTVVNPAVVEKNWLQPVDR